MISHESVADFYRWQQQLRTPDLTGEAGHFNVFSFDDLSQCSRRPIPYKRRDYFKISLIRGQYKVHYADKRITVEKQALLFANPNVPYNWEQTGGPLTGVSCLFTPDYFHHFGNLESYPFFRAGGTPVLELTDEEAAKVMRIYEEMLADWNSGYEYRYDRMRNLVYELLHQAVKMHPQPAAAEQHATASQKLATRFMELLESQFTAPNAHAAAPLRAASEFADVLLVHVNHLNKILKEVFAKSTSELIQERVLMEARILLKHSDSNIADIAYALGFKETTHFNNFFKKHIGQTPSFYRNA